VKYGPVTPEKTGLICVLFLRHGKKNGTFSQISQDILDRLLQSFNYMKVLWVQMIELYLIFRYFKESGHGNQLILVKCHER